MITELETILIGEKQAYGIVDAVMAMLGITKRDASYVHALEAATEIIDRQLDALDELIKLKADPTHAKPS